MPPIVLPNHQNMQKTTENINTTARRLDKACEYVSDLWFPVNSELLAKLKMGVRAGVYDLNPEELVSSVTADFSLYMYCLRELLQMLNREGVQAPPLSNPVEVLRQAGLDRLKKILSVEEHQISKHSFESIDEFQSLRLSESLVSASSAQTLAKSYNVSEETGYSAALLRQLGHTLLAWNYPSIYKESTTEVTEAKSLDMVITEKLGFSPTLLAIRLLIKWGMPPAYCEAVFLFDEEDSDEFDETNIHNILGGSLSKLCCVGEALARANNPKVYPSAAHDWDVAREEIEKRLGKNGITFIQEALAENLEGYLTFMPELFNGGLILDPELHNAEKQRGEVASKNPYIILCEQSIKNKLTALYMNMAPNVVNENLLSELVKDVIPGAGYNGGYIYSIDPGVSMLVPQTKFGIIQLKDYKMVDYSIVASGGDSICVAFRSNEPVIEYGMNTSKELITGITGIIGYSNRVGVLYLEIYQSLFSEKERYFVSAFKAFSQTITDCLNLK